MDSATKEVGEAKAVCEFPMLVSSFEFDEDRASELSFGFLGFGTAPERRVPYEISPSAMGGGHAQRPGQGRESQRQQIDKLLSSGEFAKYYFEARLVQAVFGRYCGEAACQILLNLSFHGRDESARFSWASIRVDVAEDSDDDKSGEGRSDGSSERRLRIVHFQPVEKTGRPVTLTERVANSARISVSLQLPGMAPSLGDTGAGLSVGRSHSTVVEKTRAWKMMASRRGDPTTAVVWTVSQNQIDKTGIPARPKIGLIVVHRPERRFRLVLTLKAKTALGIPVRGVKTGPIVFNPGSGAGLGGENSEMPQANGLCGGTVELGGSKFGTPDSKAAAPAAAVGSANAWMSSRELSPTEVQSLIDFEE